MNVIEESGQSAPEHLTHGRDGASEIAADTSASASAEGVAASAGAASEGIAASEGAAAVESADVEAAMDGSGKLDRKRLEEQLEALKRKELELRRALVIADHPALADGIRVIEGRAFALGRVEAKLAQGLSKSEERRRETIDKKLTSLREKRAELDAQIGALEGELRGLGAERQQAFESERQQALEQLLVALGQHEPALRAAGIDAASLVPEIARWVPEVHALAETLVAAREATRSERTNDLPS